MIVEIALVWMVVIPALVLAAASQGASARALARRLQLTEPATAARRHLVAAPCILLGARGADADWLLHR